MADQSYIKKFNHSFLLSVLDEFTKSYGYRAAALSFYTIMSMVPLLMVIATVCSLLPINPEKFIRVFYQLLPSFPIRIDEGMILFSKLLIKQRGLYGIVGFFAAYYFSSTLFFGLHKSLGIMFEDPYGDTKRMIIQFFSVPIFLLGLFVVNFASIFIGFFLQSLIGLTFITELVPDLFLSTILSVSNWVTFFSFFLFVFLLYHWLCPRPSRTFTNSLVLSGLISFFFTLLKNGFGLFINVVAFQNPIYGAFSGLFGFFTWVFLSYMVVLFGARILFYMEGELEKVIRTQKKPSTVRVFRSLRKRLTDELYM